MDEVHTIATTLQITLNASEENDDESYIAEKIAVPILFALIFIVGVSGNGVLIFTVLRNAALRTKPNILIVSLALGDFILILISVPFTSTYYSVQGWWYGDGICKLNEFMQTLSLGVSQMKI